LERGHQQDLEDVAKFLSGGYVTGDSLRKCLAEIQPDLIRYPAKNPRGSPREWRSSFRIMLNVSSNLPGADLVEQGLADLKRSRTSDFSLLLQLAGRDCDALALKFQIALRPAPITIFYTSDSKAVSVTTLTPLQQPYPPYR